MTDSPLAFNRPGGHNLGASSASLIIQLIEQGAKVVSNFLDQQLEEFNQVCAGLHDE